MIIARSYVLAPFVALGLLVGSAASVLAQGALATVNGKPLTEADMKLAETEIGPDIASLPDATKRRVLIEYLIENQLFSEAAEGDKLAAGAAFEARMQYWRRRALRDLYFDKAVKGGVAEAEAKKFYDDQVKAIKPEEEVQARHILVEKKELAVELADKVKKGGDLGFFGKGQMVPAFEEAAFKLTKGQVSEPIETQFGWHVIKVDEKRTRPVPTFDTVKERIMASLTQQKAQQIGTDLRTKAKIEYLDADIKKQIEAEKTAPAAAAPSAPPAEAKKP